MKTQVGNQVRSASVSCAPSRCGPSFDTAATSASSQLSCFQISPILAARLVRSMPRAAPCQPFERYMAPWQWLKPGAVQLGDAM